MSKERFYSWLKRLEYKAVATFCSAVFICLMLLAFLHLPYEERPWQLDQRESACSACKLEVEGTKEEHIKQALADLSSLLHMEENYTSGSQEDAPKLQVKEVVKVIEGWELPAVSHDRPQEKLDDQETYGEARRFRPMGSGAFLFIQFGAYRGGSNTFMIVGLGPKALHAHGNPNFECSWVSNDSSSILYGKVKKYLPDWGLGKQYSVVVIHCTFEADIGVDGRGGRLEFVANHGSLDRTGLPDVHFVALTEEPKVYDGSIFKPPYKYDYLYCGSPLFGAISPQRMREWIAYHVRLLGPRSHFILYDVGGIHDDVRKILEPWVKLGFVTISNIRQEARYDEYYFSQFLINNDCLFRSKALANWTFFFDVDEYIHIPEQFTFDQVMLRFYSMGRSAQQVFMKQRAMNHNHCVRNDSLTSDDLQRQWGFEKLVYRLKDMASLAQFGSMRKYAIQARYALATGVHGSAHTLLPEGVRTIQSTIHYADWRMDYYHYHNTVAHREELCQEFVDPVFSFTRIDNATHVFDNGIAMLASAVQNFEFQAVGKQPYLP